jgi:hypothetical protein
MVAAVAALGVTLAAAAAPALAAQRPGGPAASQARPATGPHTAAGRMSPGAPWAHIAAGAYYTCGIRTDTTPVVLGRQRRAANVTVVESS